jgi:peptidoglycan-N-acetylglucosamine deacetylase
MHASWFPKPVYKIASNIAILTSLGCMLLGILWPLCWIFLVIIALFWIVFFLTASFTINSGVYLKTVCHGPSEGRKIAITFDDGPDENTIRILEILAKHNARASFFLIGEKAKKNSRVIDRIRSGNHTIGNHSYHHRFYFPIQPVKKIINEIAGTQEVIRHITGAGSSYFRPPFGVTNPLLAKALKDYNLTTVGWSVRSFDTVIENPDKVLARIIKRIKPGSIILLHDTTKNVISVVEGLLLYCEKENYSPVSLDELLHTKMDNEN